MAIGQTNKTDNELFNEKRGTVWNGIIQRVNNTKVGSENTIDDRNSEESLYWVTLHNVTTYPAIRTYIRKIRIC